MFKKNKNNTEESVKSVDKLDMVSFNSRLKNINNRFADLDSQSRDIESSSLPDSEKNNKLNEIYSLKMELRKEKQEFNQELEEFFKGQSESSKNQIEKKSEEVGGDEAENIKNKATQKIDKIVQSVKTEGEGSFSLNDFNKVKFDALSDPKELTSLKDKLTKELEKEDQATTYFTSKDDFEKKLIQKENIIIFLELKIKELENIKKKEGDINFNLMLSQEDSINKMLNGENLELIKPIREKIHSWNVRDSKNYFNNENNLRQALIECQQEIRKKEIETQKDIVQDEISQVMFNAESIKREIKSFDEVKELANNPNFLNQLENLKDSFKKQSLSELKTELKNQQGEFLLKLEIISSKHGVSKELILSALENEEEKIRSQVVAENIGKTISVGKLKIPTKSLIKMGLFSTAGLTSAFTLGVGGVAAVGIVGKIENYFQNKKINKKIENKKDDYYKNNSFSEGMSNFILKSSLDKKSEEFFQKNSNEESLELTVKDYIDNGKYKNFSPEAKTILKNKLIVELMTENSNKEKINNIYKSKNNQWKEGFNNVLNDLGLGANSKAEANLAWGSFFTGAAIVARQNIYVKTALGLIGGWKLGGLAAEAIYGNEKQEVVKMEKINTQIDNLKKLKNEKEKNRIYEEINISILLLAKIESDIYSKKITDPKEILSLEDKKSELKSYINLISIKLKAESINNEIENEQREKFNFSQKAINTIYNQVDIYNKEKNKDLNKFKKILIKSAGAALFASLSMIGLSTKDVELDNQNFNSENIKPELTKEVRLNEGDLTDKVLGQEELALLNLKNQGIDTDKLSSEAIEKIEELGKIRRVGLIERGDGISSIGFQEEGVNQVRYETKVTFIDERTGIIHEDITAERVVVHPGDQVVAGENKTIVILKSGYSEFDLKTDLETSGELINNENSNNNVELEKKDDSGVINEEKEYNEEIFNISESQQEGDFNESNSKLEIGNDIDSTSLSLFENVKSKLKLDGWEVPTSIDSEDINSDQDMVIVRGEDQLIFPGFNNLLNLKEMSLQDDGSYKALFNDDRYLLFRKTENGFFEISKSIIDSDGESVQVDTTLTNSKDDQIEPENRLFTQEKGIENLDSENYVNQVNVEKLMGGWERNLDEPLKLNFNDGDIQKTINIPDKFSGQNIKNIVPIFSGYQVVLDNEVILNYTQVSVDLDNSVNYINPEIKLTEEDDFQSVTETNSENIG